MTIEMRMLLWATAWGILQEFISAQAATSQRGIKWNLGNRDQKMPELTGLAGRLERATKNFHNTFPYFAVAVLWLSLNHLSTSMTVLGAEVYFFGRVAYFLIYAAGIPVLRSLVWILSVAGIVGMLFAIF